MIDVICISTHLFIWSQFPDVLKFIFVFIKQNVVFQVNVMFDGQKWKFVSIVTLASQQVSYLENDWVLMAQISTTFSIYKYVKFKQQNVSNIMAKDSYFEKCVFHMHCSTGTLARETCLLFFEFPRQAASRGVYNFQPLWYFEMVHKTCSILVWDAVPP